MLRLGIARRAATATNPLLASSELCVTPSKDRHTHTHTRPMSTTTSTTTAGFASAAAVGSSHHSTQSLSCPLHPIHWKGHNQKPLIIRKRGIDCVLVCMCLCVCVDGWHACMYLQETIVITIIVVVHTYIHTYRYNTQTHEGHQQGIFPWLSSFLPIHPSIIIITSRYINTHTHTQTGPPLQQRDRVRAWRTRQTQHPRTTPSQAP